jgi:hypothetical protein
MAVKTEELDGGRYGVTVACDACWAEQCAGTYYDETRAASRGGAEHIVVPQAVARGWDHVRQEGKMVDTCPACKAAMQQNDA